MAAPTTPSAGAVTDTGGSGRSAAGGTGVLIGRSFRTVLREWGSGSADGGSGQPGRIDPAGRDDRRGCGGRARPVAGERGGQDVRGERAQHRPGGGAGAFAVGAAAGGG